MRAHLNYGQREGMGVRRESSKSEAAAPEADEELCVEDGDEQWYQLFNFNYYYGELKVITKWSGVIN